MKQLVEEFNSFLNEITDEDLLVSRGLKEKAKELKGLVKRDLKKEVKEVSILKYLKTQKEGER